MADAAHPMAPHHLPGFITPPGEADFLFTGAIIFFIILIFAIGSLYFRLHALPERIAHGTSHLQFQLVAVLSLLALVTHNNLFWVAALLLALVPIPDFWTPLTNMADSLAVLASRRSRQDASDVTPEQAAEGPATDLAPSTETAAHQLPPQTISPAAVDGGPPKTDAAGHSSPGNPPDSWHRAPPAEGREP